MRNFDGDQEVASQLEVDATLELASQKEKLIKQTHNEMTSSELLVDANVDLASKREKQAKASREEFVSVKEVVQSTEELTVVQDELSSLIEQQLKSADENTNAVDELNDALEKRIKMEEELGSRKPIIDYASEFNQLNKSISTSLGEQLEAIRRTVNAYKGEVDINDKYRKQAEKEYAKRYGLFRRMNKTLEKTAKKSESGLARMGSKLFMGATDSISDKLNDLADSIPVLSQLNTGRKFIKENMRGAKETKIKRLTKERAAQLRNKAARGEEPEKTEESKKGEQQQDRDKENKTESRFNTLFDILRKIRDSFIVGAMINMMGSAISGIASAIGSLSGVITGALGTLGTLLGTKIMGLSSSISSALGKTLGNIFGNKTQDIIPDVDVDANPNEKKRRTKKGERNRNRKNRNRIEKVTTPDSTKVGGKPNVNPTTPKANPKSMLGDLTGFFKKHLSGTAAKKVGTVAATTVAKRAALAAIPIVGTMAAIGLTAYDVYKIADETGILDDIGDNMSSAFESMKGAVGGLFGNDPESDIDSESGPQLRLDGKQNPPSIESTGNSSIEHIENIERIEAEKAREKREIEARIANVTGGTSGFVNNQISNTVVNNNSARSVSSMATFQSGYQTTYQRGSEIKR